MNLTMLEIFKAEMFGIAIATIGELLLIYSVIKVATFLPAEALNFFLLFFLANLIAILLLFLGGYCAGANLMMASYKKQDKSNKPPKEDWENYNVDQQMGSGSVS